MKQLELIGLLVQREYDNTPQPGRDCKLNVSFYVGDSNIEVAMSSDYQLLQLTVDLTYYTHNNARTIKEKRRYLWVRGSRLNYEPSDSTTTLPPPSLVIAALANELTEDYKVKP